MGYRTIIARYVAKWGIAQMCLCETKYQRGVSHHFWEALTSLKKYRVHGGYRPLSVDVLPMPKLPPSLLRFVHWRAVDCIM